jgi:hypothetical protein
MTSKTDFLLNTSQVVPLLSLIGVVLNALGGRHLGYDLLGGKRGPLRLLSRLLTYSAALGLGYGATLGLGFGVAGALVIAPTTEYQLRRRAAEIQPSNLESMAIALVRGLSSGVAGWPAVGVYFGIAMAHSAHLR